MQMTALDTARAIYEKTVEGQGLSVSELSNRLRERAEDIRMALGGRGDDVRGEISWIFENSQNVDMEAVGDCLEETARDIADILGQSNITISELPSGIAGQAQLDGGEIDIDPDSILSNGGRLIDRGITESIRDHEIEHTKQSSSADVSGIEIGGRKFSGREIREAAAISVQRETGFLSDEYKRIMTGLPMSACDRALVRQGEFRTLEKKKNGA